MLVRRNTIVFILVFMASFCATYAQSTLHAIIVVKTEDTAREFPSDPKPAWKLSMQKIEDELDRVEVHTDLNIQKHYFVGTHFDKSALLDGIDDLQIGEDDVLWFYFAGHGYGDRDCKYPNMVVSRKKDANGNKLYISSEEAHVSLSSCDIQDVLIRKNARLTIGLYETCNYYTKDSKGDSGYVINAQAEENYKVLFEEAKGYVFITASKNGQYAGWNTEVGGYFTHWFLERLHYYLRQESIKPCDWYTVGASTIGKLKAYTAARPEEFDKPQILYGAVEIVDENGIEIDCRKTKN
ncbi:hypothetical protein [Dokdonia sp.]|uniref:hypothetical protein n=1 Tax=Dokdonia sp. TaxID=2024995 RepID=UPI003266C164